jgi:hypothetical protein
MMPLDNACIKEELIAELSSVLNCYRLQIGSELQAHAAYLHREEPKALFKIFSAAGQAADLIAAEAPILVEIVAEIEPAMPLDGHLAGRTPGFLLPSFVNTSTAYLQAMRYLDHTVYTFFNHQ